MPDDYLVSDVLWLSLQFSYVGSEITLDNQQQVRAPWLDSEDTSPLGDQPGFWYEWRDTDGNVAWRQSAPHPIRLEVEGPSDDTDALTWVAKPDPSGAFTAQAPLIENAPVLALVGSPPIGADPGPVQDLWVSDIGGNV
jgi:hypothetical protein